MLKYSITVLADAIDAVGALLDDASMRLLARLGALPVVAKRAALGGKAGQPLVKVVVVASDWAPAA